MEDTVVILESFAKLPHVEMSDQVAALLGLRQDDVVMKLRHQQGIVWENLSIPAAEKLVRYLNAEGFPARTMAHRDLVRLGTMTISRKGELTSEGLVSEDQLGNRTVLAKGNITLAQAGWIKEEVESSQSVPGISASDSGVYSHYQGIYREAILTHHDMPQSPIGWVLHVFDNQAEPSWIRIFGQSYIYPPVVSVEDGWTDHFIWYAKSLMELIPPDASDQLLKAIVAANGEQTPDMEFDSLHQMIDRARYELTIKRVKK